MDSCPTLGNELSEETHVLTKQETIGKGRSSGELQGKGTQENSSAAWLLASGFMAIVLVSRLSLANHSDSGSFLMPSLFLNQDGFQQQGF